MFPKDVKIHRLFPTWVFEFRLPNHEAVNARWAEQITESDTRSRDQLLFQSRNNLHELPEFAVLTEHIYTAARTVLEMLDASYQEIVITGCWANRQKKESTFQVHSHPNSFLSGVYYVKTPKNSGSIVFKKKIVNDIIPLFKQANGLNEAFHKWVPEAGMMLIFPSSLEHYVERNKSDEERMSISFNLMFRGLLGSNPTLTTVYFD